MSPGQDETRAPSCLLLADRHQGLLEGIQGLLGSMFAAVVTVTDEPSGKKRILVIEDEPDIVRGLRDALEFEGFEVQARGTGAEGLVAAMDWAPDCVLLDLMLPDDNGYRVCETLRQRDETVPIIILTAKAQESDKIRGLDAGADDYVSKPFSAGELLARIRVALRHTAGASHEGSEAAFKVGELQVDLLRRHVSVGGRDVRLTPLEYRLLATLVRHAGKVVTHPQLLREVWGPTHDDQAHYVRVYMAHLRHKLEAEPARPRYLLTEPGVGYRLAAE